MRYLILSALVLAFSFPLSADAQMQDPILTLPDGQVILNISATERKEVEQDLLVSTLSYSATSTNARDVQNEINKAMKAALKMLEDEKDKIKFNTGSYNLHERNDPRTKERKWFGSQSVTIKSKDAERVLKLSGELQDKKFKTSGLNYALSPETAVKVQDSLMEDALKQLQTRANRAAKALGKSKAELRDVNVNGGGIPHQPRHYARGAMAMDMAEGMSAPVAAAGDSTITLSVNARVILKP